MHIIDSKESTDFFLKTLYNDIELSDYNDKFIAVDTEFIRENLEKPLLCLVQIATAKNVFIIDPLSVNISFLEKVFNDSNLVKVFHSAEQDVEMFATFGITIKNLYDTQLYEMVLNNKERISYKSIVIKYLDKKLKKNHSISDWKRRPLTKKQMQYSIEDVTYLREVFKKQRQELVRLNRLEWLDDESRNIIEKNAVSSEENPIFNELLKWREDRAKEKNIDPECIVKRKIIKSICKKGKDFIDSMRHSRHVKKNEDLKKFLNLAEKKVGHLNVTKKTSSKNTTLYLLKAILEIRSRENNIVPSIIATTEDLIKIADGHKDVRCISGWRNEIFGSDAIEFLNGNLYIYMDDSKIKIEKL